VLVSLAASFAERLAASANVKVLIINMRNHIGNAYNHYDEAGYHGS